MANLSKIKLGNVTYDIKDAVARQMIEELPSPMVFKGTVGTNGTVSDLPTASSATIGYVYKVITEGTYASQAAKVGDVFVCNDTPEWVLVPSGDEPSGTVTNVATGEGLQGGPITTSGTISVDYDVTQRYVGLSIVDGKVCITYQTHDSEGNLITDSEGN